MFEVVVFWWGGGGSRGSEKKGGCSGRLQVYDEDSGILVLEMWLPLFGVCVF